MWVRDSYACKTTQALDACHCFIIDQAHAVPEKIAALVLYQQCALAYGEGGSRANADQTRLVFPELVTKAILLHLRQCRPFLSVVSHVLALVKTNRAAARRLLASGE